MVSRVRDVELREAGAVECVWGGEARIGTFYEVGLAFVAFPDAEPDYVAHVLPVIDTQYTIVDTLGDGSRYSCAYGQCSFDLLVDGVWVGGFLTAPGFLDDAALEGMLEPILGDVVVALRAVAADVGRPWTVPDDVVTSWGDCDDESLIVDGLREVFDKPDLYPTGEESTPIESAVQARVESSLCTLWADDLTLVIEARLVPGGSWALAEMIAARPEDPYLGAYAPVAFEDAGTSLIACSDGVGCSGLFAIGGSLVEVRSLPADRDAFIEQLGSLPQVIVNAS